MEEEIVSRWFLRCQDFTAKNTSSLTLFLSYRWIWKSLSLVVKVRYRISCFSTFWTRRSVFSLLKSYLWHQDLLDMSLNQVPVLVSTVESYYVIEAQLLQVLSPLSLVVSPMRCGKTFLWTAHDQESGLTCPPGIYVQEIPPGGYQGHDLFIKVLSVLCPVVLPVDSVSSGESSCLGNPRFGGEDGELLDR